MKTKKALSAVPQRPLVDCTLGNNLPHKLKNQKLEQVIVEALIKAAEMVKSKVSETTFIVNDWFCKMKTHFRKELRHHVNGYVFELSIGGCSIMLTIDQQAAEEPSLFPKLTWRLSPETITPEELRKLYRERLEERLAF
ncbi:MAG: hypothetical protein AAB365_02005 [Patescibacteria group bacterium]